MGKKERAYDKHISPLVAEIKLCKRHKINAAMQFALDPKPDGEGEPLYCTTVLPVDESDAEGHAQVNRLRRVMQPPADFMAFTITRVVGRE
jgi:hypothetical protein